MINQLEVDAKDGYVSNMGNYHKDLSGQKFGRWTVLKFDSVIGGHSRWICRCDCGVSRDVKAAALRSKESQSCGCLAKEIASLLSLTHGEARHGKETVEFNTWSSMIGRCSNSNHKQFYQYGGRGISVCKRWADSYQNFLSDMGRRPSSKHSIDRFPNNNGNYEPGNCRWATSREQNANTRSNRFLTALGKTQIMIEWERETGIGEATIRARLKRGWSSDMAVSIPANSFQPLTTRR